MVQTSPQSREVDSPPPTTRTIFIPVQLGLHPYDNNLPGGKEEDTVPPPNQPMDTQMSTLTVRTRDAHWAWGFTYCAHEGHGDNLDGPDRGGAELISWQHGPRSSAPCAASSVQS